MSNVMTLKSYGASTFGKMGAGNPLVCATATAPTVFNRICIKLLECYWLRLCNTLAKYQDPNHYDAYDIGEIQFYDDEGILYPIDFGFPFQEWCEYNGIKYRTQVLSFQNVGDSEWCAFDGRTSRPKWLCRRNNTPVYLVTDETYSTQILPSGWSIQDVINVFGARNPNPFNLVIDCSSQPFDVKRFNHWRFYNGHDASSYRPNGGAAWTEGEILASADGGDTWYSLGSFAWDDLLSHYGGQLAFQGDLRPGVKGDFWRGLDLSTRKFS